MSSVRFLSTSDGRNPVPNIIDGDKPSGAVTYVDLRPKTGAPVNPYYKPSGVPQPQTMQAPISSPKVDPPPTSGGPGSLSSGVPPINLGKPAPQADQFNDAQYDRTPRQKEFDVNSTTVLNPGKPFEGNYNPNAANMFLDANGNIASNRDIITPTIVENYGSGWLWSILLLLFFLVSYIRR